MVWTLKVYTPDGATELGTLAEAHSVRLTASASRMSSALTFTVDFESTADVALLKPRRVVKVTDGLLDLGAYFVHDQPALVAEPGELPGVSYTCPSLDSWLGSGRIGGAVVWPYGGLAGKGDIEIAGRWDPRRFGPYDADFDDADWPGAPAAGPLTTEGWPDDQAAALSFRGKALFRRTLPTGPTATPARMFLVAQWDVEATVYRNSEPLMTKRFGETGMVTADVAYDGLGDTIVIEASKPEDLGDPGDFRRVGWTWMELDVETDFAGNETYTVGEALRRTFDPVDFPDADSFWLRLNGYDTTPGVTVGYVLDTLISEAQDRGALNGLTYTFTGLVDSDGEPWVEEFTHGWRLGSTVGWVAEQLTEFGCDWRIDSDGVLIVQRQGGTDRSATVTLDRAEQISVSGQGLEGNALLVVTPGGVAKDNRPMSIIEFGGARVETAATFGTAVNPEAVALPVADLLDRMAWPRDDAEIVLSEASPQPFDDFFLLDLVSFPTRGGATQAGRVVQLDGVQNDQDGSVDWTVTLDAVSASESNPVTTTVTETV